MHELLSPNYIDISKSYNSEFLGMSSANISIEELLSNRDKIVKNIRKSLSEKDKKFLMSVNDGSPDFSLIPIKHVQELPAIKWKVYNVKNMGLQKRNNQLKELEKILYTQKN